MSKNVDFLKQSILTDSDGNPSKIISVRGNESGLDHLEITTQSPEEQDLGIATRHRIFTEEVDVDKS